MEMKRDLNFNSLLFGKQIERVNNKWKYKNKLYIYIYIYKLLCTLILTIWTTGLPNWEQERKKIRKTHLFFS